MSRISKRTKVMQWFLKEAIPSGVVSFEDVALMAAKDALNIDAFEAAKYVQRYRNSLWQTFLQHLGHESKRGIYPTAIVVDSASRRIESSVSHYRKRLGKAERRLSGRLGLRPSIYRAIEAMDDRSYEALCCLVCQTIGAKKFHLTPKGNEGGIDFVALIENRHHRTGYNGLRQFRIIGQAKKYEGPVTVGDVRDFNDTMSDVRRLSPPVKDHLPEWFRETHTPIIGWMVGHSGFQSGSETKSKMNGIMLLDTQSLTEVLAFSRTFGSGECPRQVAQRIVVQSRRILKHSV